MASLNRVMLIGNLTRDPELKYTPKGTAVAEIGLAINRKFTAENGEKREETTFVGVTLWGRLAELAGEYLTKGKPVYIEGRISIESWDDKTTGKKQYKTKVVGETMQFLGSSEGGQRQAAPPPRERPAQSRPAPSRDDLDTEADDIPFDLEAHEPL